MSNATDRRPAGPRVLLCDCAGSMAPDAAALSAATGLACDPVATALCTAQIDRAAAALQAGGPVLVACGQMAATFEALAEDLDAAGRLSCVDIRDRAGWGDGVPAPKMAALLAESRLPVPGVPTVDVESAGVCLVYGAPDVALAAAERLAPTLAVTAMLTDAAPVLPPAAPMDIVTGRIARLSGALGQFRVEVDVFAPLDPAGRGMSRFGAPRDGARTECDLVVDLSGGQALVPAPHKRDGYLRADPGDPLAVERLLAEAAQMVGTFEKPLHIRFTESLCAHSRASRTGCTRCLNLCPTGAITPNGDHVAIDPMVCAGCGACAAVCPSGAAASDEPPVETLFARMRVLATTYLKAGGAAPRLLVHDDHGAEMIRLGARLGRGLPAEVIPLETTALAGFGHAEQLAALGLGFVGVDILAGPRTERAPILDQIALAEAIVAGTLGDAPGAPPRLRLIDTPDPDAMLEALHERAPGPTAVEPILAAGGRRETVRLAARALAGSTPPEAPVPLPAGAPYGAVVVDTDACTLCLSCAGLCPTGALGDNPDRPELSFREEACIQCGLCADLCPETAIRLVPQLELGDAALRPRVLKEEEPFACIECGALFGVRSTIERIAAKLDGVHSMFQNSDNARLIRMCDDCRVRAQYHSEGQPFRLGERPRPRSTQDYLADRDGQGPRRDN